MFFIFLHHWKCSFLSVICLILIRSITSLCNGSFNATCVCLFVRLCIFTHHSLNAWGARQKKNDDYKISTYCKSTAERYRSFQVSLISIPSWNTEPIYAIYNSVYAENALLLWKIEACLIISCDMWAPKEFKKLNGIPGMI